LSLCRGSNLDLSIVQSVARHYTDWGIPPPGLRHAKAFIPKLSTKLTLEFLKLNKSEARQVTGLLTGHCHSKGQLFKLGITNSSVCGRCHKETHTATHIVCQCVTIAELIFRRLDRQFMEPSDYDEISLCKIPYFVRGTGLLAELSRWRCTIDRKLSWCKGRLVRPPCPCPYSYVPSSDISTCWGQI
jgi:hypothetical protein